MVVIKMIKNKFIYIVVFVFLCIILFYCSLPSNLIFTNDNVTVYIEQYGVEKQYITEKKNKKRILNNISAIQIRERKNQHLLFTKDGIVITVYGKGIRYKSKEVSVVHIYISEKNKINTIELDNKDYSFKNKNTALMNDILTFD